ncbi:hypothetical protein ACM66B_004174 [Microbotryomycetes sp. NB124-2]
MQNDDLQALLNQLRESQDKIEASTSASTTSSTTATQHRQTTVVPSQAQLDNLLQTMKQNQTSTTSSSKSRTRDLTNLSYAEAVPIVQSLCMDDNFVKNVKNMVERQSRLETGLAQERDALRKELMAKGTSAPGTNSKLRLWDKSALARWQKLHAEQQSELQQLGVPTFYRTKDAIILKKQARVLNVLLGFLERDDDDDA